MAKKGKLRDWVNKVFKIHKETSGQDVRRSGSNILMDDGPYNRTGPQNSFFNYEDAPEDAQQQLKQELEQSQPEIKGTPTRPSYTNQNKSPRPQNADENVGDLPSQVNNNRSNNHIVQQSQVDGISQSNQSQSGFRNNSNKSFSEQMQARPSPSQTPSIGAQVQQSSSMAGIQQAHQNNSFSQNQISNNQSSNNNRDNQLEQLVFVLTSGPDQDKARAVEVLFNLSTEEKLDKQRLAQLGVVEPLIKLLYSDTELATLYASYMLNNLTSIEVSRNDMNDYGAIKALLFVLNSDKKSLVSKKGAMRALGRLARIQEQAQEIVSQGGLSTIINVLQMEDHSLVKRTLIALYFIGADKQQLQSEIANTQAIELLLRLAKHENQEIQAEASDCIKVLSRNVECARVIIANQGLAILGDLANGTNSNNKAKQSAHKALQRLSEIQEIKEQVIQTVGKLQPEAENENEGNEVEQVVYLMTKGNPFIQIQTAQQIANAASEDPKVSRNFTDQGVVQPLIKMVMSGDLEQKVSGANALSRLAGEQNISLQIYKSGAFPKLVQLLKQTSGQKQEGPAACIDRVIGIKGAIQDLNDIPDGFQGLMDSLDQGTSVTQSHMARVLYLCAADPNCCRQLLQVNNLSIILRQCWRAKQDTKVFCLSTIQDLIRQQPESCNLIVQIGIIPVLNHLSQHTIQKIAQSSSEILKMILRQNPVFNQQLESEQSYQESVRKLLQQLNDCISDNAPNFKKLHQPENNAYGQPSYLNPIVEEVFSTIPRHIFISVNAGDLSHAQQEVAVPLGNGSAAPRLMVPPAWIDALAIDALHVLPGESVFDVGSGSGFMTAAFAYLTGQKGSVTASEISNQACEYAGTRVTYALQSRALTSCSPIILPQNVFVLISQNNLQKQDKIYVGASCPTQFIPLFLKMLKPNGTLVIPCDGKLLQIVKTKQQDQVIELCAFNPPPLQVDGQAISQAPKIMDQPQPKSEKVDLNKLEQQLKQQQNVKNNNPQDQNGHAQGGNKGTPSRQQQSNGVNKDKENNNLQNKNQPRRDQRPSVSDRNKNSKDNEKDKIDKEIKQGMQEGLLMTIDEIEVIRNQDGKKCKLGEGGFGVVYKAAMNGVDEVAVKIVKADNPSPKELELFLKEVKTLSKLHHRNIVQFYGVCLDIGSLFFVMELMKGGDLYTVLRHHPDTMRWDKLGRKVALDVALGINYLHTRKPPMMHRDLKSPNVLLSEEGVAKIADVGMVRQQVKDLVTAQPVMTPLWAAPEVMRHEKASVKADIWSYGILIWEIVTGNDITEFQPLGITKLSQSQNNRGKIMQLPPNCSPAARKVFEACTQPDPKKRPSAQFIVGLLKEEVT